MVEFVMGLVVGAAVATLVLILVGGSRRIRAEKPLDRDIETQLLLGEDPDEQVAPPETSSDANHPRNYSAEELAQLRRLGSSKRKKS